MNGAKNRRVRSLLIVDDNPADVDFVSIVLRDTERFEHIFSARTGLEALEMFRAYDESRRQSPDHFPPVVILLDINMPRMDGFEFLDEYSQIQESFSKDVASPAVFVMTSSTAPEDRERARSYGLVVDYLTKPLTEDVALQIADRFGDPAP